MKMLEKKCLRRRICKKNKFCRRISPMLPFQKSNGPSITPKISLVILLTACQKILIVLAWSFDIGSISNPIIYWYFSIFSSLVCMILQRYSKEKFCLGHSQELKGECQYHSLLQPHTSPYFWPSTANRNINVFFSQPSVAIKKSKMAAIIFVKKILSTRSPKLCLPFRLWKWKLPLFPVFSKRNLDHNRESMRNPTKQKFETFQSSQPVLKTFR